VSVAFKILLCYGDFARCHWGPDYCDAFYTHVRFYLEGRKNLARGCAFLCISRPAGDNPDGIYFAVVRAKAYFRAGYVLPHIDHRAGAVDHTRTMSIRNFVAFLHSALVTIGLAKEEVAQFATEAAAKTLPQENINPWRGLLRGMAFLVEPPISRRATSRLARHRPMSL
jgi:hypothetical protein